MAMNFKRLLVCSSATLLIAGALDAQEGPRFTGALGLGFTSTVGATSRRLDTGWNISGSAGMNFTNHLGLGVDLGYNHLGIGAPTLANVGFPGGNIRIFSATLNPVVKLNPGHHFEAYVTGGGGLYHVNRQFTAPSSATFANFDPFFGFYQVTVPTTAILDSYSINKPGVNIGMGFTVGTRWRAKFFAEARYHRVFTNSENHIDYVPVSFGLRW